MRKDKYTMKAVLQNARAMRTASLSGQNKQRTNISTSPNNNNTISRSPTNNSNRSPSPISSSMPYMNSQSFIPQQSLPLQHQQLPTVLDQFSQQSQSQYQPYAQNRKRSLVNPNINFSYNNNNNNNNLNKYNANLSCVMSQPSFSLSNYPITTQTINHNSNYYGHDKQPFNGVVYGYADQESQPLYNNYNQHQSQNFYQPDQLN